MAGVAHGLKSAVAIVLDASGLLRWVHRRRRPHILVLAYHRVTPDDDMAACAYPAMHVAASTFRAQLRALRQMYRVIPMTELQALLQGARPLDAPVAVITFDDGYRDNARVALPILIEENLPATFFVSLDFVDRARPFWFDRLAVAAGACGSATAATLGAEAGLPPRLVAALVASQPFAQRVRAAAAYLKTLPDGEREAVVAALERAVSVPAAGAEPMTWDEVRGLRAAGMQVGAHGVRHGILTRMPAAEARREIADSVTAIAERVGAPVTEFAYPNGDADAVVARLARECGVQLGFTMAGRSVQPGGDPLRIARRNVCEDTSRGVRGRFSRAYFWCEITGVFDVLTGRHTRAGRAHA
jgi:peptidoglycan/xylan/chitin deacetylase (PgdA/CDA1 family)